MFKFAKKLSNRQTKVSDRLVQAGKPLTLETELREIPSYPPFMKGLPPANPEAVALTQKDLIQNIYSTLGFSRELRKQVIEPMLMNYVAYVHLLPASEEHHHRSPGGLLYHGLESANIAAQMARKLIFVSEGTPKQKREGDPKWRLAACITGLFHDAGKPVTDVSITDAKGSKTWNPYTETLFDWCNENDIDRYFIRWRKSRHKLHQHQAIMATERLLPRATIEFLRSGGDETVLDTLYSVIAGNNNSHPLANIMLKSDQESVRRDMGNKAINKNEGSFGIPIERYVFDAIRRLINDRDIKINEAGALVWHTTDGTFLQWKELSPKVNVLIAKDKVPGIPKDSATLADILVERGYAEERLFDEGASYRYHKFKVRMEAKGIGKSIEVMGLKLDSPNRIFTSEPPAELPSELVDREDIAPSEAPAKSAENGSTKEKRPIESSSNNIEAPPLPASEDEPPVQLDISEVNQRFFDSDFPSEKVVEPVAPVNTVEPPLPSDEVSNDSPAEVKPKHSPVEVEEPNGKIPLTLDDLQLEGEGGRVVKEALSRVLSREQPLGKEVYKHNGAYSLIYPGQIKGHKADPKEVLQSLYEQGVIKPDPVMGGKLHDLGGTKCIVFNAALNKKVSGLISEAEEGLPDAPLPGPTMPNKKLRESQPTPNQKEAVTPPKPPKGASPKEKVVAGIIEELIQQAKSGKGKWLDNPQQRTYEGRPQVVVGKSVFALIKKDYPNIETEALKKGVTNDLGRGKPVIFTPLKTYIYTD